jgi:hypothetical protein
VGLNLNGSTGGSFLPGSGGVGSRHPYSMGSHSPPGLHNQTHSSASFQHHHLGLNEFLWSAGLAAGLPHSAAAGLFPPSLLSAAFPAFAAAQAWAPKTPTPPSSLFAQYMMANNPPAMYPFDLSRSRRSHHQDVGMNLSPRSGGAGGGGSESSSPAQSHSNGHASPCEEVINLAKNTNMKDEESDDSGGENKSLSRQKSINYLREKAKTSLIEQRSSPTLETTA